MKTKLFFIACLLVAFVLPAGAQETPPEGGEPKGFSLPEKTTFTLDNGLSVTMVPYGAIPKVAVRVIVRSGNLNETENQVWLADLTGDLLSEGTPNYSSEALAQKAASMGGSVNIGTGLDQSTIGGDVLSEFGPDLIRLLADVAMNPSLPAAELDRLKRDRLRTLSIQKTQPGSIASERYNALIYPNHPYGRFYPTEEMLTAYTIEDVQSFYNDNFGAKRTHVYVSGKFNSREMEKAIREAFAGWKTGIDPMVNIPEAAQHEDISYIDLPGSQQSNVYVGLPVVDPSHPDYVKLLVMNNLLGGSFASRITSNIREDKGYTYSPRSQVSIRYRTANWAEVAAITTESTGPAISEIFHEITRLQNEAPGEDELSGIKNYMAGIFVLRNSSRGGIVGQLSFLDLHGLEDSYLTDYVNAVHAVTPADVQEIAQKYLGTDKMQIVIVGDQAIVEPQMAQVGKM